MPYDTYVFDISKFLDFISYLHGSTDRCNDENIDLFEEAKSWNYKLVIPTVIIFEIIDKIRLRKVEFDYEVLNDSIKCLKQEYDSEFENCSDPFLQFVLTQKYSFSTKFSDNIVYYTELFYKNR